MPIHGVEDIDQAYMIKHLEPEDDLYIIDNETEIPIHKENIPEEWLKPLASQEVDRIIQQKKPHQKRFYPKTVEYLG